jgi:hypothetical protein
MLVAYILIDIILMLTCAYEIHVEFMFKGSRLNISHFVLIAIFLESFNFWWRNHISIFQKEFQFILCASYSFLLLRVPSFHSYPSQYQGYQSGMFHGACPLQGYDTRSWVLRHVTHYTTFLIGT